MKKLSLALALALSFMALPAAHAAPWKNDRVKLRVDFPKSWFPLTAKIADQRKAASTEPRDSAYYTELAKRIRQGSFYVFEDKKTGIRADVQYTDFGKPIRSLGEQDIRNLCPRWAQDHESEGRTMIACSPFKLGTAWTARMEFAPDPSGAADHQIQRFDPAGKHVIFTVRGTRAQADVIFGKAKFY